MINYIEEAEEFIKESSNYDIETRSTIEIIHSAKSIIKDFGEHLESKYGTKKEDSKPKIEKISEQGQNPILRYKINEIIDFLNKE